MKQPDLLGAWACSSCHDVVDGRITTKYTKDEVKLMFLEGVIRTQTILIKKGIIEC